MRSLPPSLRSSLPAAALCAVFAAPPAAADLYGFIDERGVTHYSNVPLDQRYRLLRKDRREAAPAWPRSNLVITTLPAAKAQRVALANPRERQRFAPLIDAVAREQGLDAALLHAVIAVESGYDPRALSPKGAAGLMQLMPATARRYAVSDIWDPRQNVTGGARYLRDLLAMFGNNLGLALAAYNAGEGAVARYGNRIPPYPETRSYVPRVLDHYRDYVEAWR